MKQRAIKRCIKRTKKQFDRGTYRGRMATVAVTIPGAIFVTLSTSILRPVLDDCQWSFKNGFPFSAGHAHWFGAKYKLPVAVSYAK